MDQSRILLIGKSGPFRTSDFRAPPNLAEFGAVIWYPKSLKEEWEQWGAAWTPARLQELIEWVKKGNALIIVGAPPPNFSANYIWERKQFSVDVLKSEIFRGILFKRTSGHLIEFNGPESLSGILANLVLALSYDAILESKDLVPLFRVSTVLNGEEQIVGAYKKMGAGVIAFLPPLLSPQPMNAEFFIYHREISSILEFLKPPVADHHPDWLENFQTPHEQKLKNDVSAHQRRVVEIEAEVIKLRRGISIENSGKHLFTATGDAFCDAVADALRELGISVVAGPRQRADLLAWDGKRLAAIEVKGLESGAREKNIGQVRRWVADVDAALSAASDDGAIDTELLAYQKKLADLGIPRESFDEPLECKGIAILNTHRKLPLDERPESFGEPVRKVILRSGICALTGLQLFLILKEIRLQPSKKATLIDKLFSTTGLLDEGLSWREHLLKIS